MGLMSRRNSTASIARRSAKQSVLIGLVLAAHVMVAMAQWQFPPTSSWCGLETCPLPPSDTIVAVTQLQYEMFGNSTVCGDGICNVVYGETCKTCPTDCGASRTDIPITKCVNPNQFALSFDDGPSPYTQSLLTILAKHNVSATFFMLGSQANMDATYAQTVQMVAAAGHDIASHTFSHRSLGPLGEYASPVAGFGDKPMTFGEIRTEMVFTDLILYNILGRLPALMRPPFLEYTDDSLTLLDTMGFLPIIVNVDTLDWNLTGSDATAQNVLSAMELAFQAQKQSDNSFISLQHDILQYSVNSVDDIITYLKGQNVELVPMSKCLGVDPWRPLNANPFLHNRLAKSPVQASFDWSHLYNVYNKNGQQWKDNSTASTTTTTTTTACATTDSSTAAARATPVKHDGLEQESTSASAATGPWIHGLIIATFLVVLAILKL